MRKYLSAFFLILLTTCLSATEEETDAFLRAVQGVIPGFLAECPTTFDETAVFPDDAPIPLPRHYGPLVELLRFLQTPGLTFGDARERIEEMSPLIQEISGGNEEPWPPLWHIVMRYGKTFSEEERRIKGMEKPEEAGPRHIYTAEKPLIIGQTFRTQAFFQEKREDASFIDGAPYRVLIGLQLLGVSEEKPVPGTFKLGVHKLFFMRYFGKLLYELNDLYRGYMRDKGEQASAYSLREWARDPVPVPLVVLTEGDFPKLFKDVFDSVAQQKACLKIRPFETDWNIFHHVNAMLPHIVYVDY